MYNYPARVSFDEENDEYVISFRDFENLHSVALTEDDIELAAQESLTAAIGDSIADRLPLPPPSVATGDEIVLHLPVLTCLKMALHNAMIASGTRKADLARKLNQNSAQTDRLLDVGYASKVETLEQALYLLGYEVSVQIRAI
ncbi:hypothetical protein N5923_05750 [Erwiniaceae bacterium BAC15a-03b]|uniref:HicB-like antitoxin of toxin-antitoxin system domain-containing protein n=1 Tax=Winslowiella arboricola TaxID=2978220 RepID=A0A9J6PQI1_9GAMM|nr:hypothetical protein [Winslowiella arboricola]MCU5774071.1 hypothetical protein [Winslowiella arboricola]MCU5776996.1 hypothetical protein [Winslowiella arboricola]